MATTTEISNAIETKVAELFKLLGFAATVQVDESEVEGKKYFDIKAEVGENAALLIGRYGNLIDALGTVINMVLPKTEERYSVMLDINGYRDERTQYLKGLASRSVEQVISSGQAISLPPMKPWERRIVHMVATENTNVATSSEGVEPDRKVVISPAASDSITSEELI